MLQRNERYLFSTKTKRYHAPQKRVAVFADGCFWHGHDCRNTRPQQNKPKGESKRKRNQERDLLVNEALAKKGWTVVRIWECEIKKEALGGALALTSTVK